MKKSIIYLLMTALHLLALPFVSHAQPYKETQRISAPEANQAVAADDKYLYAIGNKIIAKYTKSGEKIAEWRSPSDAVIHLNSGTVHKGKLYCAHSDYPALPMTGSVEIFDVKTMKHVQSISFGTGFGSCTWVLPAKEGWYVFFAHYEGKSQQPGCDVSYSQLALYDKNWQFRRGWVMPKNLTEKVRPYSLSGAIRIGDVFYCTGHDAAECYLLRLPEQGSYLNWTGTVPVPFNGQGIAVDPQGVLWGIDRKTKEIIRAEF